MDHPSWCAPGLHKFTWRRKHIPSAWWTRQPPPMRGIAMEKKHGFTGKIASDFTGEWE